MSESASLAWNIAFLTTSQGALLILMLLSCLLGGTCSEVLPGKAPKCQSSMPEAQQLLTMDRCFPKISKLCFILFEQQNIYSLKCDLHCKILVVFMFLSCRKILVIIYFSAHQGYSSHFKLQRQKSLARCQLWKCELFSSFVYLWLQALLCGSFWVFLSTRAP